MTCTHCKNPAAYFLKPQHGHVISLVCHKHIPGEPNQNKFNPQLYTLEPVGTVLTIKK